MHEVADRPEFTCDFVGTRCLLGVVSHVFLGQTMLAVILCFIMPVSTTPADHYRENTIVFSKGITSS